MTSPPSSAAHDLPVQARDAAARCEFEQAIELHEQWLAQLHSHDAAEAERFLEGPHAELLLAAATEAVERCERCHYRSALGLVRVLAPRFGRSAQMSSALNGIEARCIERVLYERASPRAADVLLCCAEADRETVEAPLRAALVALGVVVAAQAVALGTDDTAAELAERALEGDTVVVVLSPALFARRWPQDVLEDMLTPVAGASHAAPPLLPVWHRITRPEVLAASEQIEKTLAFDTGTKGLDAIAQGIADIVRPDLASGALHKAIWASTLQGRVLGEGRTDFQLPIRHAALDDELLARIRVLRAAFIDGGRQTLPAWVDAFRREMEPLTAIIEWERLARAFHEIRWLQRHLGADAATQTAALAALVPDDVEPALRERMRAAYLELVRVPPERLFKMVWALSQTVASVVDLGFSAGVLAIASHVLEAERPPIEATDSFDPGPSGIDLEIESFDVSGEDWSEGVLHHEEERPWSKPWDVFVSHASEDKASLVRPLAEALQEYGVKVWYDNFTLRPGCSLGRSIDAGIDEAEFGIVVLSPSFVAKEWPRYEFDALRHRHTERGERLITLWHGLRVDDAPPWAQGLDGVQGLDSSAQSTTELAMNILKRVRPDLARHVQRRLEHRAALERQRIGQTPTQRVQFGALESGPRRHERLPLALQVRVRLLQALLGEVDPHSMAYWLDGFLRDYNPEREVMHWLHFAAMFHEAAYAVEVPRPSAGQRLLGLFGARAPTPRRADVYRVLNQMVHVPPEHRQLDEFKSMFDEQAVQTIMAIAGSSPAADVY